MDPGNGDLGSVVRGGPPPPSALTNDHWPPSVASYACNTWPLDYGSMEAPAAVAAATSVVPHFVSDATVAAASPSQCVSPYLLLPSIMNPIPPVYFQDLYKTSFDCGHQLYQEPCSSSLFARVDPPIWPCALPFPHVISTELDDRSFNPLGCCQETANMQVSMPMPALTFSHDQLADKEATAKDVSRNTTPFTITNSKLISPCAQPMLLPIPSTSSPIRETTSPTTMPMNESHAPGTSSTHERQAENVVTTTQVNNKNPSSKRRKAQQKRVVCVPATGGTDRPTSECLPSDSWAWRKYGQKPIKGSPYPRGYYRCSSSKGCTARKQVERSRSDPSMLVITYTSDHNHAWPTHRNASGGSARPASLAKPCPDSSAPPSDGSHEISDNIPLSSVVDSPTHNDGDQAVSPTATMDDNLRLDQDADLEIESSDKRDDDFFAQLEELPESFVMDSRNRLDERSDGEDGSLAVDPFNLFNWSANPGAGMTNSIW